MTTNSLWEWECDEQSGVCEGTTHVYYTLATLKMKAEAEGWTFSYDQQSGETHHTCPSCNEWLRAGGPDITKWLDDDRADTPMALAREPEPRPRVRSRVAVGS